MFRSLNFGTNLLSKLLRREPNRYNCLVLNLYDMDKGYSLGFHVHDVPSDSNNNSLAKPAAVKSAPATAANEAAVASLNAVETDLLSYDETELLFYVNAGEIPPILIDLIDRLNVSVN